MWLTRLALKNPVFILMVSLMLIVLGIVSLNKLSVDLFPDITIPVIRIATFYTGAGPADIEKSITQPIERAVSASPGVDRVESSSKQGVSLVSVWFNYGTNLDNAQFEVSQRIAQILNTLPPGIQQPFVLKFDITNIPILAVTVSSDSLDEKQLYDLSYNTIEPQLERIQGVASASVGGGKVREIEVMANRNARPRHSRSCQLGTEFQPAAAQRKPARGGSRLQRIHQYPGARRGPLAPCDRAFDCGRGRAGPGRGAGFRRG
jgi:multidrug efflux pump subunit AcrB